MKNIEKVVIPVIIIVIITMLGIYYISKEYQKLQVQQRTEEAEEEASSNPVSSDELVYVSTAVLVGKDTDKGTLKFISADNDKLLEFDYTDKIPILGKHGNYLTLDQVPLGEIFDVTYSLVNRELFELKVSDDAWTYTEVTKFTINEKGRRMDIAGSTYKLPKTAIVSYGDELATFMDVTDADTLTVKGYGRKVCSIIVERGHGYVRLINDSYFEGGWIEIGQEMISKVGKEMLIPVPEGSYHVRLTNQGYAAEEDVTVERDKETVIDLSKADIKEVAIGHVQFTIVPDFAHLFIDGDMMDYEERVPLEYGIHKVHVELAGYKDVDISIRVSDKYADVNISLEEDGDDKTDKKSTTATKRSSATSLTGPATSTMSSSTSTLPTSLTVPSSSYVPTPVPSSSELPETSSNYLPPVINVDPTPEPDTSSTEGTTKKTSSTKKTTTEKDDDSTTEKDPDATDPIIGETPRMYIESPEDVEIYVDGIYAGITPISFIKPDAGSHVITLSRNGYKTKSYTVSVDGDDSDVTMSFSELVEDNAR